MRARGLIRLMPLILAYAQAAGAAESSGVSGGRLYWMLSCQGCHRSDGAGTPGRVPPIKNFVARFLTVAGGREFLVRVPGVAFSPLSDRETVEVMNWMLYEFDPEHLPADFRPYTLEEVAELRKRPLFDPRPVRAGLVAAIERAE